MIDSDIQQLRSLLRQRRLPDAAALAAELPISADMSRSELDACRKALLDLMRETRFIRQHLAAGMVHNIRYPAALPLPKSSFSVEA